MPKITVKPNCGNSPKMMLIRDLNMAFAERQTEKILDMVGEDIIWEQIGSTIISGKIKFMEVLKKLEKINDLEEVHIQNIMSHGKVGAANGEIILKNGERYGFADIYNFTNTKGDQIAQIISYNIKLEISK